MGELGWGLGFLNTVALIKFIWREVPTIGSAKSAGSGSGIRSKSPATAAKTCTAEAAASPTTV